MTEFAGKLVLVNFWAAWCTPCITEMPSIQRLAKRMADKPFAVIGVNVAEPKRRVQATVTRLGLGFPVLLDTDSAVFDGWGATVLPTTYVLNGAGRIRYIGRGPLEWDGVETVTLIEELLQKTEDPQPQVQSTETPANRAPGCTQVPPLSVTARKHPRQPVPIDPLHGAFGQSGYRVLGGKPGRLLQQRPG